MFAELSKTVWAKSTKMLFTENALKIDQSQVSGNLTPLYKVIAKKVTF